VPAHSELLASFNKPIDLRHTYVLRADADKARSVMEKLEALLMDALTLCGVIGTMVGELRAARGDRVLGARRTAVAGSFAIVAGDIADPLWWDGLAQRAPAHGVRWPVDAVLLCANPGVRRGRDNGLARAAALVTRHLPTARWSIPAAPRSTPTPTEPMSTRTARSKASDSATALLTIERAPCSPIPARWCCAAPRWSGRRARTALERLRRARAWSRARSTALQLPA